MAHETKQDALRNLRVDSDDTRVLKTRRKLVDAYRRLADADPGAIITVTAIAREAGVTRSTFYTHFSDANELAVIALTEFQDAVIEFARTSVRGGESKTEVNSRVILDIARFLDERRDTYRSLIVGGGAFADAITATFVEQNLATLRTRSSLHANPDVTARYLAGGLMQVLTWWLDSEPRLSPEELATAVIAIAPPDFVD
jgi:AcrR family transcriptional regulator